MTWRTFTDRLKTSGIRSYARMNQNLKFLVQVIISVNRGGQQRDTLVCKTCWVLCHNVGTFQLVVLVIMSKLTELWTQKQIAQKRVVRFSSTMLHIWKADGKLIDSSLISFSMTVIPHTLPVRAYLVKAHMHRLAQSPDKIAGQKTANMQRRNTKRPSSNLEN